VLYGWNGLFCATLFPDEIAGNLCVPDGWLRLSHDVSVSNSAIVAFVPGVAVPRVPEGLLMEVSITVQNPSLSRFRLCAAVVDLVHDDMGNIVEDVELPACNSRSALARSLGLPDTVVSGATLLNVEGAFPVSAVPRGTALVLFVQNHNFHADAQLSVDVRVAVLEPLRAWLLDEVTAPLTASIRDAWDALRAAVDLPSVRFFAVSDTCLERANGVFFRSRQAPRSGDVLSDLISDLWVLVDSGHRVVFVVVVANLVLFLPLLAQLDRVSFSRLASLSLRRALSSAFAHADVFHLIFNMAALAIVGPRVHVLLGCNNVLWAVVYTASALGGCLAFAALSPAGRSVVGASGAISGLDAAVVALGPTVRMPDGLSATEYFVVHFIVQAGVDFVVSRGRIAVAAHLGGAVTGYAVSQLLVTVLA
jgi:membrane associated rhomboid family serine protease